MRTPLIAIILLICFLFMGGTAAKTDPGSGRVRLLHIGMAFLKPQFPDSVFLRDPKIDLTMVPSVEWTMENDEIQRTLRLYLPRNKKELDGKYDLVLIDGIDAWHLKQDFSYWVVDLVRESDLGFVMCESGTGWSFAGSGTSWYITPIGEILSVDDVPGREVDPSRAWQSRFHLVPVDPDHELMRNIPWEQAEFHAFNRPTERLGTRVVAGMSGDIPDNRGKPAIVYLDYPNGGRSVSYIFTIHTGADAPHIVDFYNWRWHYDVLVHLIYWPAKEPIPGDLALVHAVRELISKLYFTRLYVISTVDFADRVGANLRDIELKLAELEKMRKGVDSLYIDNRMEECHDLLLGLGTSYDNLINRALMAKDRAMLWIFVVEWAVVAATSMITGAAVWMLLVERRLYRDVERTRLRVT